MIRSMLRRILPGEGQASISADNHALRQAISLVLHEHSESTAVHAAAADAQRHAEAWFNSKNAPSIVDFAEIPAADTWLTASLGHPAMVRRLAKEHDAQPTITCIDQAAEATAAADFFRAPANLNLPETTQRTIVLAAIVRPGGREVAIVWDGPFQWPSQQSDALRSIERLIQAYVGQWRPPKNVWAGGAEDVLPAGEVMDV